MDMDMYNSANLDRKALIAAMGSPEHLTDDLDLTKLADRLDDEMLERVRAIANSPLPPVIPCSENHMNKILRTMLAVLPRRSSDDISGELFVAAYQHKLGHLPNDAVSHIADKALETCKWFPTIAECLELVSGWRRVDAFTKRRDAARELEIRERNARRPKLPTWATDAWKPTPEEIARIKSEAAKNLRSQPSDGF